MIFYWLLCWVVIPVLAVALCVDIWRTGNHVLTCRARWSQNMPGPPVRCRLHPREHEGQHEAKWKHDGVTTLVSWDEPPDAHLSVPVRNGKEVRDLPDDHRVPIAEVVRWAERRAIAQTCPLDGDPHRAVVVPLPQPGTHRTGSGGWVGEPPFSGVPLSGGGGPPEGWIDVTAFGDGGRVYIPGPSPIASPPRLQYPAARPADLAAVERSVREREAQLMAAAEALLARRRLTNAETGLLHDLIRGLEVLDAQLADIRRIRKAS